MKINKWLLIPSVFALSFTGYSQNETVENKQTLTHTAKENSIPEAGSPEYNQAFKAMGYAMAKQVGADMEFGDKETALMAEGFLSCARGEDEFEGFKEATQIGFQLYGKKRKAILEENKAKHKKLIAEKEAQSKEFFEKLITENPEIQKSESGLYYEIIEMGDPENKSGPKDNVTVNYEGKLIDGTVFDSSYKRNKPSTFKTNGVVKGFSEGIQLIGKGGKIKLYIPAELGYGNAPRQGGPIKAGDALIFTVEILDIQPSAAMNKKGLSKKMPKAMPKSMRTPPPAPPSAPPTTPPPPPPGPPPSRVSE